MRALKSAHIEIDLSNAFYSSCSRQRLSCYIDAISEILASIRAVTVMQYEVLLVLLRPNPPTTYRRIT
jgi:hypothetical protein